MFADRADAGRALARRLVAYRSAPDAVVLGIPRGGVVVAAEVAEALGLPLGVAPAAKVGAPGNPEYAAGAMSADGVITPNPAVGLSAHELEGMAEAARDKVALQLSFGTRTGAEPPVKGRTVVLVDDGLATGLTALAAIGWLRRVGAARVIVAVPVAAADSAAMIAGEADELVTVDVPAWFGAVGQFYRTFGQTQDEEVVELLERAARRDRPV
jgi:putative phosphoribosyl transferase